MRSKLKTLIWVTTGIDVIVMISSMASNYSEEIKLGLSTGFTLCQIVWILSVICIFKPNEP